MNVLSAEQIRREVLNEYLQLSPEQMQKQSRQLLARAQSWLAGRWTLLGLKIGAYHPMARSEPQLQPLWNWLSEQGAIVSFPMTGQGQVLRFSVSAEEPALDLGSIDLLIIPGLAFGLTDGGRIGRGRGWYDRTLAVAPQAGRLALALDFQLYSDPLPLHPGDQSMDWILSPSYEFDEPRQS